MKEGTNKDTASKEWRELMALAQQGCTQSYSKLLTEVASYLRGFYVKKLEGAEAVEDVVQETLLTIHRARHTFDSSKPFKPWLNAIASSRLTDHWRRQKRLRNREILTSEESVEGPGVVAEHMISKMDVERLQGALDLLSEQQQQIIRLLKFDGWPIKKVAKELKMSESAVKVSAHRGYKKVYEVMHEQNL